MAHIVGVPKREPCRKCSLPVFLAERQIIGKSVYHRTCLKCARCKTQLTPGSFYETEIDGEFCCETCPDEEQSESLDDKTENYHTSNLSISLSNTNETKNIRNSIADRLAFFEMNCSGDGKKLLQKSLSDEEKSQSLKKITEFKPNTALLKFMNDSADDLEYIQNTKTEYNPVMLPPMSLHTNTEENVLNSSPFVEDKSNIILNTRESDDSRTCDVGDSLTILPLEVTESNNNCNNNNSPNVSVNVTKEKNSNSNDIQSVHMATTDELFQQISDSENLNVTKSVNAGESGNDLQLQNMIPDVLNMIPDDTIKSESETEPSLTKNTSEDDYKVLSFNKYKEINNIVINLNDRSKEIIDSNDILVNKEEEEEVPKCTDNADQDSYKIIDNLNCNNASYTQENKISEVNKINFKSSTENQLGMTETVIVSIPVGAIQDNHIEEKHEHTKFLENDEEKLVNVTCTDETEHDKISTSICTEEARKDEIGIEIKSDKNKEPDQQPNDSSIILKTLNDEYPEDLNPFQTDENEDVQLEFKEKVKSLNPFGSDEDDDTDEQQELSSDKKSRPPRPPPPKISKNPFGSASDNDDENDSLGTAIANNRGPSSTKKVPVPTPRTILSPVKTETSEPEIDLNSSEDYYGSSASLNVANNSGHREIFHRHHEVSDSNTSLTPSVNGRSSRKSKKAPAPPPPNSQLHSITKELFGTDLGDSIKSSPNSSGPTTPQQLRKKRPAPKPPAVPRTPIRDEIYITPTESPPTIHILEIPNTSSELEQSKPEIGKLSDEEKAAHLIEKPYAPSTDTSESESENNGAQNSNIPLRRLISLDKSLLEDSNFTNVHLKEEHNVVYRRSILPPIDLTTPTKNNNDGDLIVSFPISLESVTHDRQLEKMKDNKEAKNRNRQSQCSDDLDPLLNKSIHGKWKRRKGPAPSLPVPPRKILQMLPLQEIRHELEIIEVQQQGLEKQGVILETMIRERCENKNDKLNDSSINKDGTDLPPVQNSKEVEDLILQLFELVNEKNELFRRQAELMYLRRQHRLEQEQADLEYEIRVLMAQPERNKTDTDKAREEALIARLVEVVQLRNEVIECLEMDRLREAEEDLSIKQRLELHTAKRDEQLNKQTPTKLSKKEKKKQKESKKLEKSKKLDADKDADESEITVESQKDKKKKKKFLF